MSLSIRGIGIGALVWFCLLLLPETGHSQYYILGRVLDDDEVPYGFSTARLNGDHYASEQTCTDRGVFRFENLKPGNYELVLVTPYGIRRKKIDLKGSIDITLHVARNIRMDEISVIANKAGHDEPVTHDDITATQIKAKDFGRDMPYLLEQTPSVVTTSDAGAGIGYTGMRIRGTDPTRINVTLNGIPVNDAESQEVFWVDLPDLASSTTNIQVQRGLGWSQPGTGDFGGAININTLGFHFKPYAGLLVGAGTYDTKRAMLSLGSGLWKGRFTLDARGSLLHADGYIDRAKSDLRSLYACLGYHHDQNNIRFIVTTGHELTYQAWNGVPEQYINVPGWRTYNTAGTEKPGTPYPNEVDNYTQTNAQLHFDQAVTPFARLTTAFHYTKGLGFFEQYKANQKLADYNRGPDTADLVRRLWLNNDFYGFTSTLHFGKPESRYFILGGGWNKYIGDHFGSSDLVQFSGYPIYGVRYYEDEATKKDGNIFVRTNMKITKALNVTLDLQQRWLRYQFVQLKHLDGPLDEDVHLKFFNPKIGLTFMLSDKSMLYALSGLNHKEPNRDDYVNSTSQYRSKPERLWDTETGFRFANTSWKVEITGYYMNYRDQLVPTGRLNEVGAYTRVNVRDSHRAGIETSIGFKPVTRLELEWQSTFSQNKIKSFDEYIDNWTTSSQEIEQHHDTDLAFSPTWLSAISLKYTLISNPKWNMDIGADGRYVGKQFVDNTSNPASALDPYWVSDLGLSFSFYPKWMKEVRLGVAVNNILNESYESNGWIYRFRSEGYDPRPDDPYAGSEGGTLYHDKGYFPQALRNAMVQLSFDF